MSTKDSVRLIEQRSGRTGTFRPYEPGVTIGNGWRGAWTPDDGGPAIPVDEKNSGQFVEERKR